MTVPDAPSAVLESTPAPGHASDALRPSRRVVIEPRRGRVSLRLGELWTYRELISFFVWRDLKVRYRQTVFGVAWVVMQPLALMLVFSLFLGEFLEVDTGATPYPVFVFCGLVPWILFSQSLVASAQSLVANANLLGKIYFPRLVLPISAVGSYAVDFVISSILLIGMVLAYGLTPSVGIVAMPLIALLIITTTLGFGIFLSAVNVRYRDVQSGIPLLIQVWLFASPIAYPLTLVPSEYRTLYGINPFASVVEGFRAAVLGTPWPPLGMVEVSVATATIAFLIAIVYFRSTERTFADVV